MRVPRRLGPVEWESRNDLEAGGWQLLAVGGWQMLAVGGWQTLAVGGWQTLAVGGWQMLAVDWAPEAGPEPMGRVCSPAPVRLSFHIQNATRRPFRTGQVWGRKSAALSHKPSSAVLLRQNCMRPSASGSAFCGETNVRCRAPLTGPSQSARVLALMFVSGTALRM